MPGGDDIIESVKIAVEADLAPLFQQLQRGASDSEARMDQAAQHMTQSLEGMLTRATTIGSMLGNVITGPIQGIIGAIASIPKTAMEMGTYIQGLDRSMSTMLSDQAMGQAVAFEKQQQAAAQTSEAVQKAQEKIAEVSEKTSQIQQDHAEKLADIRQQREELADNGIAEKREALAAKLTELEQAHNDKQQEFAQQSVDAKDAAAQKIEELTQAHTDRLGELSDRHRDKEAENAAAIADENAQYADRTATLTENYQDRTTELYERHTDRRKTLLAQVAEAATQYQEQEAEAAETHQEKLADLAESHAERLTAIREQMADAAQRYRDQELQEQQSHLDKLESMEEAHQERLASLQEQIGNARANFAESVANSQETLEDKKDAAAQKKADAAAQYQSKLANARTQAQIDAANLWLENQNKSADASVTAAEKAYDKQVAKAQAAQDKQIKATEERIAKENEHYAKQEAKENERYAQAEARNKASYDRQVDQLNKRLTQEDASYEKQSSKENERYAKEEAKREAAYAAQTAKLNAQLTAEDAEYAKQIGKLDKQYDHDLKKAAEVHQAKLDKLAEKAAKEDADYERAVARENDKYEKDIQHVDDALAKQLAAIDTRSAKEEAAYAKAVADATAAEAKQEELIEKQTAKKLAKLAEEEAAENKAFERRMAQQAKAAGDAEAGVGKAQEKVAGKANPVNELPGMLGNLEMKTGIKGLAYVEGMEASTMEEQADRAQKRADAMVQWIKEEAKTTPYTIQELERASNQMIGSQMDPTKWLRTLGDTAAATKVPIDQIAGGLGMLAAGVPGEAVERLRMAGINLRQIAGLKWSNAGELLTPPQEAMDKIKGFLDTRFGGLMEKMANSWQGVTSNFQDLFQQTIGDVTSGAFEQLNKAMLALYTWLDKNPERVQALKSALTDMVNNGVKLAIQAFDWVQSHGPDIEKIIDAFIAGVQGLAKAFGAVLPMVIGFVQEGLKGLNTHGVSTSSLIEGIVAALLAMKAAAVVIGVINGITAAMNAMKVAFLTNPVGVVLAAIAAAIVLLTVAWQNNWGDIQGKTEGVWKVIGPILGALQEMIGYIGTAIGAIASGNWGKAFVGITNAFLAFMDIFGGTSMEQLTGFMSVLEGIFGVLRAVGGYLGGLWKQVEEPLQKMWGFLQAIFTDIMTLIGDVFSGKGFGKIAEDMGKLFGDLGGLMGTFAGTVLGLVGKLGGDLLGALGGMLGGLWKWITDTAPEILNHLGEWTGSFLGWAGGLVGSLFGGEGGGGGGQGEGIAGAGGANKKKSGGAFGDLWNGLTNWITTNGPGILTKLGEWTKVFGDWVGQVGTFLFGDGKNAGAISKILGGLWEWIKNSVPDIIQHFFADWVPAAVVWVATLAVNIVKPGGPLANFLGAIFGWIKDNGPGLATKLVTEWIPNFLKWIWDGAIELVKPGGPLANFLGSIGGWIKDTGAPEVGKLALSLGSALVNGIWDGITKLGGWLWGMITQFAKDNIEGPVKKFLGIQSPSTVFSEIGKSTLEGFQGGVSDAEKVASLKKTLDETWKGFTDTVGGIWSNLSKNLLGGGDDSDKSKKTVGQITEMVNTIGSKFWELHNTLLGEKGLFPTLTAGISKAWADLNVALMGDEKKGGGVLTGMLLQIGKGFGDLKDLLIGGQAGGVVKTGIIQQLTDGISKAWVELQKSLIGSGQTLGTVTGLLDKLTTTWTTFKDLLVGPDGNTGYANDLKTNIINRWLETQTMLWGDGTTGTVPMLTHSIDVAFSNLRTVLVGPGGNQGYTNDIKQWMIDRWTELRATLWGDGQGGIAPFTTNSIDTAFKNLRNDLVGEDGKTGYMKTLRDGCVNAFEDIKRAADAAREAIEALNRARGASPGYSVGGPGVSGPGGGVRGPGSPGGYAPSQIRDPSVQPGWRPGSGTGPPNPWEALIQAAMAKNAPLPFDEAFIKAVMQQENPWFDPKRESPAGAIGLMQLMPFLARDLGVNPYDPAQNLEGGIRHLAALWKEWGGNIGHVLAAYNSGSGNVQEAIRRGLPGGIPNASMGPGFAETAAYVPAVLRYYQEFEQYNPNKATYVDPRWDDPAWTTAVQKSSCGPAAASGMANWAGKPINLRDVVETAEGMHVWNAADGMSGTAGELALLAKLGISAKSTGVTAADWAHAQSVASQGVPFMVESGNHYYLLSGYDANTGKYYAGNTGLAVSSSEWLAPEQMSYGGPAHTLIFPQSYDVGGVVNGSVGQKLLAYVHGGEEVLSYMDRMNLTGLAAILERLIPALRNLLVLMNDMSNSFTWGGWDRLTGAPTNTIGGVPVRTPEAEGSGDTVIRIPEGSNQWIRVGEPGGAPGGGVPIGVPEDDTMIRTPESSGARESLAAIIDRRLKAILGAMDQTVRVPEGAELTVRVPEAAQRKDADTSRQDRLNQILRDITDIISRRDYGTPNGLGQGPTVYALPVLGNNIVQALTSTGGSKTSNFNLTYVGRQYGEQSIRQVLRQMELQARLSG